MNGKPKNHAALCKSVQAADVNQMPSKKWRGKTADKLILSCLVQYANAEGKGAHPGNKALCAATGLGWSQVHEHLALLISANIIKRESVGNGAFKASVYSIVHNHPAFPDCSANNREWFIAPNHPVSEVPNHPVSDEGSSKPSAFEGETIRFPHENHPVLKGEPSGFYGRSTSKPHQEPIHPSSKPTAGGTVPLEKLNQWQAKLPQPMHTHAMGSHQKEIAAWAAEAGEKKATLIVGLWLRQRDIAGLKDLWGAFLRERGQIEAAIARGENDEAAKQKAVDDAEEQFKRQVQEEEANRPAVEEISVEEALRIYREAQ